MKYSVLFSIALISALTIFTQERIWCINQTNTSITMDEDLHVMSISLNTDYPANTEVVQEGVLVSGTTAEAPISDPSPCGEGDVRAVWYSYTPDVDGTLTVSVCGTDTTLVLYSARA